MIFTFIGAVIGLSTGGPIGLLVGAMIGYFAGMAFRATAIGGLHVATGLSGHGFGIGPAIGRIMADLLTGHPPGHDLTRFHPERFSEGSKIVPGPY